MQHLVVCAVVGLKLDWTIWTHLSFCAWQTTILHHKRQDGKNNALKTTFPTPMFHQQNTCDFAWTTNLWVQQCTWHFSIFIVQIQQDWHLVSKIGCTVHMFVIAIRLLEQTHRIAEHRDATCRQNSADCLHRMFHFGSCILLLGMHSSSRSRTCVTTRIPGLNEIVPLSCPITFLMQIAITTDLDLWFESKGKLLWTAHKIIKRLESESNDSSGD